MSDRPPATTDAELRIASSAGRWTIAVTVLGSSMVFLDGSAINVALPAIGEELDAGLAALQWTVNGYLLTLAALIILGGALGDRFGRRRIFVVGSVWFVAASMLCGLAPTSELLIAARVLQGIGGALLTPGSLAIIEASFAKVDRARAIGIWSGLAGVSTAVGPLLGGWLIEAVSWRAVFFLNLPLGLIVLATAAHLPESFGGRERRIDGIGAGLAAVGLGGISFALIDAQESGAGSVPVIAAAAIGAVSLALFVIVERRIEQPMLPLGIFRSRAFTGANLVTFVVYASLGGVFFMLAVFLQVALGYSPLEAGLAGMPVTVLLFFFSGRAGGLAQKFGARPLLTAGALVMAIGMLMMRSIDRGDAYFNGVFPSVAVFGIGLLGIVAPVTATALSSAPREHTGLASAVNNAVARTGQLFAIALLPAAGGLAGNEYEDPAAMTNGFHAAMYVAAALALAGAVVAWIMIEPGVLRVNPDESAAGDR